MLVFEEFCLLKIRFQIKTTDVANQIYSTLGCKATKRICPVSCSRKVEKQLRLVVCSLDAVCQSILGSS